MLVMLYVQFYALIGQNLTDEFMRKIYAASWNSLTAEADRVLCQLVMFLRAAVCKYGEFAIKAKFRNSSYFVSKTLWYNIFENYNQGSQKNSFLEKLGKTWNPVTAS